MRSRRPMRVVRSSPWVLPLATVGVLGGVAAMAGCPRSGASAPREASALRQLRGACVRLGPLVGEHPLYPEVSELTSYLGAEETADLRAAKAFLASPLGRSLEPPDATRPLPSLSRRQADADAKLEAGLTEATELLEPWPQPGLSRIRRRLTAQHDRDLQQRRGEEALEAVRVQMRAIEDRKGRLAELRQRAASDDEAEAARAVDEQVRLWREVAAEAEAAKRDADERLRALEDEYDRTLVDALAKLAETADRDRRQQLAALEHTGAAVRGKQPAAAAAAMAPVDPAANATDAPAAPPTESVSQLMEHIQRAQRAAWERRRVRLAAVRSRLLGLIAEDTRNAARAIAVSNGIEVHFDCMADRDMPDATEEFRPLLRDHWAARAPRSGRVALATQ